MTYRQTATRFYTSTAWKACRRAYRDKAGGLCEKCKARGEITAGEIVHHKIHLNADNLNDPDVALNFDNLELLCRACHAEEHPEMYEGTKRYKVDECGKVVAK